MTKRDLEIFVTVAEQKNMSAAARLLYVAPSSISQAISSLEKQFHTKLFERSGKKLVITESGIVFLNYARHILAMYQEMEAAMNATSDTKLTLKIGTSPSVGAIIMSKMISDYYQHGHQANTEVTVNTANAIMGMILENTLDLGLILGKAPSSMIVSTPLFQDELVLVCSPNHPFSAYKSVKPEQLDGQKFILREIGCRTRSQVDQELLRHDIQIQEIWTSNNMEAIRQAVIDNQGLAFLSPVVIDMELKNGRLHPIRVEDFSLKRTFYLIYHKNKLVFPTMDQFITSCKKYSKQIRMGNDAYFSLLK